MVLQLQDPLEDNSITRPLTEDCALLCEAYETGMVLCINPHFQDMVTNELIACLTDYNCDRRDRVMYDLLPLLIKTFGKGSAGRQCILDRVIGG